jgi:glyceraldehyde 3-phosphate dehydrogenase
MRVAINGFGRIGRSVYRILDADPNIDVIAINDLYDNDVLAYLLKYDTVMSNFYSEARIEGDYLVTPEEKVLMLSQSDMALLPWKD